MAPSTITETTLVRKTEQDESPYSKYKQNIHTKEYFPEEDKAPISPYYDETLSKTEPKFLNVLRQWEKNMGFVTCIRWSSAIPISLFHIVTTIWFLGSFLSGDLPKWQTGWFALVIGQMAGFGITGGAHRLWTHRSYKAKLPLRLFLLLCYSIAGQNNVYNWVRDHRLHHKMSETSADPHDARRGFFFSHIGWLMMKKHPHILREGKKIDMSDIANDPLLSIYNKHFNLFKITFCAILPIVICVVAWNETWSKSIQISMLRYMLTLNFTWSVNSFAHLWGYKPYDRNIMPTENLSVSIFAMGEGWHNYHHTFPWDYKAAELSYFFNITTLLLDMFAKIGWSYDMKVASPSLIQAIIDKRNGKLTHQSQNTN